MNVSVVIPVYNQGEFLSAAVESALSQRTPPAEVIVVDDGSTDSTPDVCRGYGSRIHYIRQENAGPSAARNAALAHAQGEAVLFLDSDDILHSDWLGEAVRFFNKVAKARPTVGVVYGDYTIFDNDGAYETRVEVTEVTAERLLRDSLLIPSGTLILKACLQEVGRFSSALDTCEDWDFWLRAALLGYEFLRVPTLAFRHREHSASASKRVSSALMRRVRFLEHWIAREELDGRQKEVVRAELARTFLRARRAAYIQGETKSHFVPRALDLEPRLGMDPWLCVFGAVYAAPFFRASLSRAQTRQSIAAFQVEVANYWEQRREVTRRRLARLRASGLLAQAANEAFGRHYASAAREAMCALCADPSLTVDLVANLLTHVKEVRRAKNYC